MRSTIILAAILLVASTSFSTNLTLTPETQTTYQTAAVYVSAGDLSGVVGLDIEIAWNKDIIACSEIIYNENALPGFSAFHSTIDKNDGSLEVVLLKLSYGGYTGDADSFLVVTFTPVSTGQTNVIIIKSHENGDPLLIDDSGSSVETRVDTATVTVVDEPPPITTARLYQNYPNPFNPNTTIRFDLPARSEVSITIYDVSGQLVRKLIDGKTYGYGSWEIEWNGTNGRAALVPSGVYFCLFEGCGRTESRKLVILR